MFAKRGAVYYSLRLISRVLSIRKQCISNKLTKNSALLKNAPDGAFFSLTLGNIMAKFLKSIFHTSDRKKSQYEHESEEERSESPQPGTRRQLSISRSGRMKQANKKRHSLALELYGEGIQIDAVEKPRSVEYHVHSPCQTAPATLGRTDTTRIEGTSSTEDIPEKSTEMVNAFDVALEKKLSQIAIDKSPEEEIDNAFEVIDKS